MPLRSLQKLELAKGDLPCKRTRPTTAIVELLPASARPQEEKQGHLFEKALA